jgi:hypothetical protein
MQLVRVMDANPFKGGLVWRKLRRTSGLDLIPIATLSTKQIGVCPVTCRPFAFQTSGLIKQCIKCLSKRSLAPSVWVIP